MLSRAHTSSNTTSRQTKPGFSGVEAVKQALCRRGLDFIVVYQGSDDDVGVDGDHDPMAHSQLHVA